MIHKFIQNTGPWGLLGSFVALLVGLWLPQVGLLLLFTGWQLGQEFSPVQTLLGAISLYGSLMALLYLFARWLDFYGLRLDRWDGLGLGLGLSLGWLGIGLLYGGEALLGWATFTQKFPTGSDFLLYGGIALALTSIEELFFRGFLIHLWQRDYGWQRALWTSTVIFALSHFIKGPELILATWPQFPGLLLMGWLLATARQRMGQRLGLSLGLHWGWVWANTLVNVTGLIAYTQAVPTLWTGLNGNPLAGLIGLSLLGGTALVVWGVTGLLRITPP